MKRIIEIVTVALGICCFILFAMFVRTAFPRTQYNTTSAVTYFDKDGRYQLINTTKNDYFLYDAAIEKDISGFLLYYIQENGKVYMVTNPNRLEIGYAILDIDNEAFETHEYIDDFANQDKTILLNTDNMIDLTKEHSRAIKNLIKFIPQKWRQW